MGAAESKQVIDPVPEMQEVVLLPELLLVEENPVPELMEVDTGFLPGTFQPLEDVKLKPSSWGWPNVKLSVLGMGGLLAALVVFRYCKWKNMRMGRSAASTTTAVIPNGITRATEFSAVAQPACASALVASGAAQRYVIPPQAVPGSAPLAAAVNARIEEARKAGLEAIYYSLVSKAICVILEEVEVHSPDTAEVMARIGAADCSRYADAATRASNAAGAAQRATTAGFEAYTRARNRVVADGDTGKWKNLFLGGLVGGLIVIMVLFSRNSGTNHGRAATRLGTQKHAASTPVV